MSERNHDNDEPSVNLDLEKKENKDEFAEIKKRIDDDYDEIVEDDAGISQYLPVYRVQLKHSSRPIIVSLILSTLLAFSAFAVGVSGDAGGDDPQSGFIFGLVFAIASAISSVIIAYFVKKKGEDALRIIMSFAFFLLTFLLSYFFGDIIIAILSFGNQGVYNVISLVFLVLCLIGAILLTRAFFKGKMKIKFRNLYVITMGILIGTFMSIIFYENSWLVITLLALISIWDIISVKKGPIRKIMELTGGIDPDFEEKLKTGEIQLVDYEFSEIEIGIGDLAFYSMLVSHAFVAGLFLTGLWWAAFILALGGAAGVLIGSVLTIKALKKNKILPGLPLSIFIGLGIVGIISLIFWLVL